MWIATTIGFFSIVAHRDSQDLLLIRTRQRRDLENLIACINALGSVTFSEEVRVLEDAEIIELTDADYRFRLTLERPIAGLFMRFMTEDFIDYDNFKRAVADEPEQRDKLPAYHNLWADLRRLQPA